MESSPTQIRFVERLPSFGETSAHSVLIYDRKLDKIVPGFRRWKKQFAVTYPVTAGESLKDVLVFPAHIQRLVKLTSGMSLQQMAFVGMGGGSVGDFTGFIASIFKRGVSLVHIPTTWLAALDSGHGGKTGLNVGAQKNQIGTFYTAAKVLLVRDVLERQPAERIRDAFGELLKIAIIDGGPWMKKLSADSSLWSLLPHAIAAKMKVVRKDPLERTGHRRLLNLGHTLGHVLELELKISHGEAVLLGTMFSLTWSHARGTMSDRNFEAVKKLLVRCGIAGGTPVFPGRKSGIPRQRAEALLLADKKTAKEKNQKQRRVHFLFVDRIGKVIQEPILISEILEEAQRQGFVV